MASFFSEHSAEYVLVPRIVQQLSEHFHKVVPVFFWANREGNTIARACAPCQTLRVISVFARRPKVNRPGEQQVLVKFNTELFDWAAEAEALGIPTFAGLPLVSSLTDLTLDCACAWFWVGPHRGEDVELILSLDGDVVRNSSGKPHVHGPIELPDVERRVRESAKTLPWKDALDRIRQIRISVRAQNRLPFFGGYKPFHLLLLDGHTRQVPQVARTDAP